MCENLILYFRLLYLNWTAFYAMYMNKVNWEEWNCITEEKFGKWLEYIPDDSQPVDNISQTFTYTIRKTQEELIPHNKEIKPRKHQKPCW